MKEEKLNQVFGDFIEIELLKKFLNDPKRLGMTKEEQEEKLKLFAEIGKKIGGSNKWILTDGKLKCETMQK